MSGLAGANNILCRGDNTCRILEVWEWTHSGSSFVEWYPNQGLFHPDFLFAWAPSPFHALRCDIAIDLVCMGTRDKDGKGLVVKQQSHSPGGIQVQTAWLTHLPPSLSAQTSSCPTFFPSQPPPLPGSTYCLHHPQQSRTDAVWDQCTYLPSSFIPSIHSLTHSVD